MFNTYASDFTTYEQVNNQLKPLPSASPNLSNDLSVIVNYIHDASQMVRDMTFRTFVPYIHTSAKVRSCLDIHRQQELPDDGLTITQVDDPSGTTIDGSEYELIDVYNNIASYPYRYVRFSSNTSLDLVDNNNLIPKFTFDGIWGYSQRSYANTWLDTTTASTIADASTVSVTVNSADNVETLDYIRIDTEFMQVTSISGTTLTVKRGVNGSTAASHTDGTQVDVWQINDAIQLACTRLASWLYMSRQNTGETVQFQDGTIAGINYPRIIQQTLKSFIKPYYLSV